MTEPVLFNQTSLYYGGDYNPEQWPESIWEEDVRLMRLAGVNLVSLGTFAWARLEPTPGQYDFTWLDRVIDLLHANGIRIGLATATASPPPWLARLHPESLPVNADGITLWPGGRQHYCPHNPTYQKAAGALVAQIARRYGKHPALALWHVNNEYGCHVAECFCDRSAAAFRAWLEQRYGTLQALNEAWGTAFWSQSYSDWDEINPPRCAPTYINPTQQLDWKRFSSGGLLSLFEMERDVIRSFSPTVPVTTNFLGLWKATDYWKWAPQEDVVSLDCYPDPLDPYAPVHLALQCDLSRSLGKGRPWILMEQATSAVTWRQQNAPKPPGQMRLWSYQAIARGANGVMFFQWRASKAGAEKFHSGMLPHGGVNTRIWKEVVQLGNEIKRLGTVLPSQVKSEVAILFDWDNWWALELDSKPSEDVRAVEQLGRHYGVLYQRNIPADLAEPGADLSAYRLVIAPSLYLITEAEARNLERYVENGGTLVVSFFSGIVDENEHIWLGGYPAPLRRVLGLRVEEFIPYGAGQTNQALFTDGSAFTCDLWGDLIDLEGARVLATFTNGYYAGRPAVTGHHFGKGQAYYIGTRLELSGLSALMAQICQTASIQPVMSVPEGVEVVCRADDDRRFYFLLNHHPVEMTVKMPGAFTNLLTGRPVADTLMLGPFDVAILHAEANRTSPGAPS
jgi:beta-galactosidase